MNRVSPMQPELIQAGLQIGAIALIVGAVMSFLQGTAPILGEQLREAVRPLLARFRNSSPLSRSELADRSMLASVALSALAVVAERSIAAGVVAMVLWLARPMVGRMVSQEHPMLALGQTFSTDLVIGLYLPITLAQFLTFHIFTGVSMLLVILALSWPAGGGASASSQWKPAWQHG